MRTTLFSLALLLPALTYGANIYECPTSNGRSVLSYKICGPDTQYDQRFDAAKIRERIAQERDERHAEIVASRRRAEEAQIEREAVISQAVEQHRRLCEARLAQSGLSIGMTKMELWQSDIWGYPDDISKTTTANVVKEYLIYKCKGYKSVRLFVTNGRLTSIHN